MKIVLSVLIICEVALIASKYSMAFDDYITLVVIALAFPLAYYAFRYLSTYYREIKDTERFSKVAYKKVSAEGAETKEEVDKLMDSPAFKEY